MKKSILFVILITIISCTNNTNNKTSELESIMGIDIISIDTLLYYESPEFVLITSENDILDIYNYDTIVNIKNILDQNIELQKDFYIEMSKYEPIKILKIYSTIGELYVKENNYSIDNKYENVNIYEKYISKKYWDATFKVLESNFLK